MISAEFIDVISKSADFLFKILIVIFSSIIGLKYLRTLTPSVKIDISKEHIFEEYITVGVRITNISKIGFTKAKILMKVDVLNIFHLNNSKGEDKLLIGEWIDFKDSIEVFKSTKSIDPKEDLYIERLYNLKKEEILHIGVQVKINRPWLSRKFPSLWPYTPQWTTTKFIR